MATSDKPALRFRGICRPLFFAIVFSAVLSMVPGEKLSAQDFYSFPFREGNFLRYKSERGQYYRDSTSVLSFSAPSRTIRTLLFPDSIYTRQIVMYTTGEWLFGMLDMAILGITENGLLVVADSSDWKKRQYVPVYPPISDTITLYSIHDKDIGADTIAEYRVRLVRQFDTTLFDIQTRVFTIQRRRPDLYEIITIADGFGFIRTESYDHEGEIIAASYLYGGIIDGRRFNWDPVRRNFMPLCDGDVHITRNHYVPPKGWIPPFDTIYFTRDTVRFATFFKGKECMKFRDTYLVNDSGDMYMVSNPFDTTDESKRHLVLPSHAEPGCVIEGGRTMIIDTGSISLFGENRMRICATRFRPWTDTGCFPDEDIQWWAHGIGRFQTHWEDGSRREKLYSSLVYANICGKEYDIGTSVTDSDDRGHLGTYLHEIRPNPAAVTNGNGSRVDITLDRDTHIDMELRNLLGRRMAVPYDGHLPAGRHTLHIDTGGLVPGVYCIVVHTGKQALVRTMVVR